MSKKKNTKKTAADPEGKTGAEKYEEIKAAAESAGESVNGYIKKAVDERMERDNI